MKLSNRVALVTGGSSGIGAATCARLAAEGARVAVVASSSQAKADIVVEEIRKAGGEAHGFVCDIADPTAIRGLVRDVKAALGPIDILVNSAGLYYSTPVGDTSDVMIDAIIDTNIKGSFYLINEVAPAMKDREAGKIINFSSVAAAVGIATQSLYCATKAAVSLMTRALACELAPYGINVNAIAPGSTKTPMNEDLRTKEELRPVLEAVERGTPSRRKFTDPDEIAKMVVYLCSDDARAMHGSIVLMDEGLTAGL